jgi:RNA polymerase sigma factor (sigma-70 family)
MRAAALNGALRGLRGLALRPEGGALTDGQLLECFLSHHDEGAFTALVHRHGPMVMGVCRRVLHNVHDAEDAFQATFLVLARKAAGVAPRDAVGAWLYGVACRTAKKAQAMTAKRRLKEQQFREARLAAKPPEDAWEELQPLLDEELSRLPAKYRSAIVLCELEGKTKKEAAAQLCCPEGTLSSWLTRGRRMLAQHLARRGVALSAGSVAAVLAHGAASASVRAGLAVTTGKAAALFAAGRAAAGTVSARVTALTEGVLKAMLLSKLRVVMAVLLAVALAGATAAGLLTQTQAADPARAQRPTAPKADPEKPPAARQGEKPKQDKEKLQGTWVGVSFAYLRSPGSRVGPPGFGSKQREEIAKATWVIQGDKIAIKFKRVIVASDPLGEKEVVIEAKDDIRQMTFKLDITKEHAAIDLTPCAFPYSPPPPGVTAPPGAESLKGTCQGIFDLTGDTLTICYGVPGMKRPAGFKAEGDDWFFLFVLKREKAAKPEAGPAKPAATDRHGDPLPDGALARLGTVRLRHKGMHWQTIAFSPDSKTMFTGGEDGKIRLWELTTGKPVGALQRQKAHTSQFGSPNAIALCPRGKVLAAAWQGGLHLWDVQTAKELHTLQREPVYALAFTPDGRTLVSGGGGGAILVWDVATGKELRRLLWQKGSVSCLACMPDGKTLVSADFAGAQGLTVHVGDLVTGKDPVSFFRGQDPPLGLSPDGKTLAVGGVGKPGLRLLDVMTGKEVCRLNGHPHGVNAVAFSPDGKTVASTGLDETIRWWDQDTGKEIRKATWREARAYPLSTPDRLAFTPDGKTLVSTGGDCTLRLWDAATGEQRQGPEGHEGGVGMVAFSSDGKTLASCSYDDLTVRLWDVAGGRPLHALRHPASVRRARFSPDGRHVISGGGDGAVRVWDAATGKEVRALRLSDPAHGGRREQVTNLALSGGGKQVVSLSVGFGFKDAGQSYRLTTWDVATGKRLNEREVTGDFLSAFSPDGVLLAGLEGGGIAVREVATGKVIRSLGVPAGADNFWYPLVFSPSRKLLAAVTSKRIVDGATRRLDRTVRVWEVASGKELWNCPTPCWGQAMAFSPDGKRLAWAGDDLLAVHDAATGEQLLRRQGFDASAYSLAFSPGGTRLATGLSNATVLVWDVSAEK